MSNEVQQIYCDESGSTGNNLMDSDQPYFSYASIAISHEEASEFAARLITDFHLNRGELKAKNLVGNHRGRKAITRLLEEYQGRILISLFEKKYSLACKLYEYVIEPAVATHNSGFYAIGFNSFIANCMYRYFKAGNSLAEAVFADFQETMKSRDSQTSKYLFGAVRLPETEVVLDLVRRFCLSNREAIQAELAGLQDCEIGRWVLDLADTALYGHLGKWGTRYSQLDVYCDANQALAHMPDYLETMIGREDTVFVNFAGKEQVITFNLSRNISLVRSIQYPGTQLADLAAGAAVFVWRNNSDTEAQKWRTLIGGMLHLRVLPDTHHIDMKTISAQLNLLLLQELVHRSEAGASLTEGIGELLAEADRHLRMRNLSPLLWK